MADIPRFCTRCGSEFRPDAQFCTTCGRPLPPAGQLGLSTPSEPPQVAADAPPVAPQRVPAASEALAGPAVSYPAEDTIQPAHAPSQFAADNTTWPRATVPGPDPAAPLRSLPAADPAWGPYQPVARPWPADPPSAAGEPTWRSDAASATALRPGRRSRWPLAAVILAVVVLGAAAVGFLYRSSAHSAALAAGTGASVSTATGSAIRPSPAGLSTSPAGQSPEQQAATALAALLAQSVTDRGTVQAAVDDVSSCGPNLNQDGTTFSDAANSRQALVTQLAALPDRSALPAVMLQDLTAAWQASAEADNDFAQWAQDETSAGCTPGQTSDAAYQAATSPDNQATSAKMAFATQWAPIAAAYALPAYKWDQL